MTTIILYVCPQIKLVSILDLQRLLAVPDAVPFSVFDSSSPICPLEASGGLSRKTLAQTPFGDQKTCLDVILTTPPH